MSRVPRLDTRSAAAALLEGFEDAAALLDADGDVVAHNRAWTAHRFADAVFSDGDPIPVARVLSGEVDHVAGVGRRVSRDGWRWYRSRVRALDGIEGAAALLTHRDITDERRLQSRMSSSPVAHLELERDGALLSVNDAWEQIRGRPVGAELGMRWLRDTKEPERSELLERLRTPAAFEFELPTIGADDRSRVIALALQPVFDGDDWFGWQAVASDQTEQRALESAATHAFVDNVTGLANRWLFEETTARALARRPERDVALLFLDLDGFKQVNDAHGHAHGDAVLRAAARRISDSFRPADLVARYGGDEFAVLVEDVSADRVHRLGQRLVRAFDEPLCDDDLDETAGGDGAASIGISVGIAFRTTLDDVDAIVERADAAMYRAKRRGGRCVEIDRPEPPPGEAACDVS